MKMNHDRISLPAPLGPAIYLLVDEKETEVDWRGLNVVDFGAIDPVVGSYGSYIRARWIHVMSGPAGGEIRGYALVDGRAHLRLPARPREWDQVDEAVATALGVEVVAQEPQPPITREVSPGKYVKIVRYEFTPGMVGSYYAPPESAEVNVTRAFWLATKHLLSEAELEQIMADDAVYESILAEAESLFEEEQAHAEAQYDEREAEVMDGDHHSALESVYGPND